jgi:RNA polymerase sigma-70 factor, ECF subfamily
LLQRLRADKPVAADWRTLHDIYTPFIRANLVHLGISASDLDDLLQTVWQVVSLALVGFERQRDGSFRAWLRMVTLNQVRTWRRQRRPLTGEDGVLNAWADPNSAMSRQWDLDHDRVVFEKLLAIVRPDFTEPTWRVFERYAIEGGSAASVARECGVSEAAVLQAKARIVKRLREEAAGLID